MQDKDNKRIPITTYVSPRLAELARDAAHRSDQKQSEYVRAALVRQLRSDGFDPAAAQGAG
jgi:hypothetical protein